MEDNIQKFEFKTPTKEIKSPMDMKKWQDSETYHQLMNFIDAICKSITGKKNSTSCNISPKVEMLMKTLQNLENLIRANPPVDQPQRFGNIAFRTWFQKMTESLDEEFKSLIPEDAIIELKPYFMESFGNSTRIDYGTGHELSFLLFLMCLFKTGILEKSDELAIALKVFNKYLNVVRCLQVTYKMEPAGR
jgi:serine/threonine-protein phosphatase 2A activator